MLFLKRFVTAAILFVVVAIGLFVFTSAVMGGIAGAKAAAEQHATGSDAFQIGQAAGQEVGRKYGTLILLSSVGVSAALSCALSFGGVFPWCRASTVPPSLPPRYG